MCLQITHSNDVDDPIYLSHASFSWGGKTDPVQLRDLNWRVREGQLVAVVGIVGSGKSSLLSSLLGDMQRVEGEAYIKKDERIAYVPQQAWMQNTTLQNNILFGKPYNSELYERVGKRMIECHNVSSIFLLNEHLIKMKTILFVVKLKGH